MPANSYRFMHLEEDFLSGPTPHHLKRLQPIRPEIPELLAIQLDAWDFGRTRDRDRNQIELLVYDESIRSRLTRILDAWQEELLQMNDPDNPPDRAALGKSRKLLSQVGYRVAPKSQNGLAQQVYLVRNPPDNEGMIDLRQPQD